MEKEARYDRCLKCSYHSLFGCSLMGDALEKHIEKCILEYASIKSIPSGSLDEFVFYGNPLEYLSWLGYKDKKNNPKPGQQVLTLTSGFGSSRPGRILTVVSDSEKEIVLSSCDSRDEHKFLVEKSKWWKRLFKLEKEREDIC